MLPVLLPSAQVMSGHGDAFVVGLEEKSCSVGINQGEYQQVSVVLPPAPFSAKYTHYHTTSAGREGGLAIKSLKKCLRPLGVGASPGITLSSPSAARAQPQADGHSSVEDPGSITPHPHRVSWPWGSFGGRI